MSESNKLSPEVAARQHELFQEALREHQLPEELTAQKVIEALQFPDHFPAVIKFLQKLARNPQLTYKTERSGTHYSDQEAERALFTLRYSGSEASSARPNIDTKRPFSKRLFAACRAHAGDGQESTANILYYLMQAVIQPKMGYEFDLKPLEVSYSGKDIFQIIGLAFSTEPQKPNKEQYGDFNLLLKFLMQHRAAFETTYFASPNAIDKESSRIAIGKNAIDMRRVTSALQQLTEGGVTLDLEAANVDKKKLQNPEANAFPRPNETSVVRRFESLFIDLDLNNPEAVAQAFGITTQLSAEDCQALKARFAPVEALLVCLLNAQQAPANNILTQCHRDMPRSTQDYIDFATAPDDKAGMMLRIITPGQASLRETGGSLIRKIQSANIRGFGSAQAIAIAWSNLQHEISNPKGETRGLKAQADSLQKIMLHAVMLITDPAYAKQFGLDRLTE